MVFHFDEKFLTILCEVVTIASIQNCESIVFFINCSYFVYFGRFADFFSYIYGEMCNVLGCKQSSCPWHSFVCSAAPDGSNFPLMLSC